MTSPRLPLTVHVDPEHAGLRIVIPLILFLSFWVSYFILSTVLRSVFPALNSAVVLSCLGAIPLSLLIAGASEVALKRVWRSGRRLRIEEEQLLFSDPEEGELQFDLEQLHNLWWSLPLRGYPRAGRERRMPDSYSMMGGQLQQGDRRLVIFTYAPPEQAEQWAEQYPFQVLDPDAVYQRPTDEHLSHLARPQLSAEVIAGPSGRYWLAERNRWQEGVELAPDDFEILLQITGSRSADRHSGS
ncbi:MAG: hypothetical protein R3272_00325 [Candidatus Promineifilaceae bacterium]|nr:hypothetical protein [Candidatus Promineifilaceae bacterium]